MAFESYLFAGVYSAVLIGIVAWYTWRHGEHLGEMAHMMSGMVFGTLTGLAAGTVYGLATGDFLWALIWGSVFGVVVGIPLGRVGGSLGRMEGAMGGPMGAFMGAMLAIMVRIYDLQIFMAFYFAFLIFVLAEFANVVRQGLPHPTPRSQILFAGVIALALFGTSLFFDYSVDQLAGGGIQTNAFATPIPLGVAGQTQEALVRITTFTYEPSTVPLKAGVTARVTFEAQDDAGCGRALVIPDFGIQTIIPRGGRQTVEFTPPAPGTYQFRCSMNMVRGQFVVT